MSSDKIQNIKLFSDDVTRPTFNSKEVSQSVSRSTVVTATSYCASESSDEVADLIGAVHQMLEAVLEQAGKVKRMEDLETSRTLFYFLTGVNLH